MRIHQFITPMVLGGLLAVMGWLPAVSTLAADNSSRTLTSSTLERGITAPASGSVEDTLEACLARIPEDASAGQRLIAEGSCKQDAQERKPIQAVPGR